MSKFEKLTKLGQAYHFNKIDSAGYPNGLPTWNELSPDEQYDICVEAIHFLLQVQEYMPDSLQVDEDLELVGTFGTGECLELMEHLKSQKKV